MSEAEKLRRPASHRWAMGLFGVMTAGFVLFLLNAIAGRPDASLGKYWFVVAIDSAGAIALLSLLLAGRQKWGYYVVSVSLAVWTLRAIYTSCWKFYYLLFNKSPIVIPHFNLAVQDKPFVVAEQVSAPKLILTILLTGLMV